jgi:hypothetical protein
MLNTQQKEKCTAEQIDECIALLKKHEIKIAGGYTTDTYWEYTYDDKRNVFLYHGYDPEGNTDDHDVTEDTVRSTLSYLSPRVVRYL